MAKQDQIEQVSNIEEKYISFIHKAGINLAVFVIATASFIAFFLGFLRLIGAIVHFANIRVAFLQNLLQSLDIVEKAPVLMLVEVLDVSLLGAILTTLAFGLRSVFMGKRYGLLAFDIRDIHELSEILIGLIITLIGTRFLERVLSQEGARDLFLMGVGVGAAILALTAFYWILKQIERPKT